MSAELTTPPTVEQVLTALHHSHDRLASCLDALSDGSVDAPSYADEWSIAQVASHLGSGAEIFTAFVEAGSGGGAAPGMEVMQPVWDRWNAKTAVDQVRDAVAADAAFLARLDDLTDAERHDWRLDLFGASQDLTAVLRLRLGEHALHTWDIAVALDEAATVPAEAAGLLMDTLEGLVPRVGKPVGQPVSVRIVTEDPARRLLLELGTDGARLSPDVGDADDLAVIELPAEAFVRLVYGRLDAERTPPHVDGQAALDRLRTAFPGF